MACAERKKKRHVQQEKKGGRMKNVGRMVHKLTKLILVEKQRLKRKRTCNRSRKGRL